MLRDLDIPRDLIIAWRLAVAIASAQLLGGAALLLASWPKSVPAMPEIPLAAAQFWLGAAFASPLGMLVGLAWQRSSGSTSPRAFTSFCTIACVVLPLVGIAVLTL
jgi:hypothetical protein